MYRDEKKSQKRQCGAGLCSSLSKEMYFQSLFEIVR